MKAVHIVTALSLLAPATAAFADDALEAHATVDHPVKPVANAFELSVGTGYAQGGGKLGGGMLNLEDIAGPGGAVELDLGYRIIPQLSVGAYGTFSSYDNGDKIDGTTSVLGATAGLQATYHIRPSHSIDPWVSLGAGWKGLWLDPDHGKTTSLQGFELARLQVGLDYRLSPQFSISPVIGGSLGMFVSEDSPMTTDYTEIQDKKVNFTGFAGLAGRFDAI
ncbi:MAG TPA: outer membrane beta-barrel protein [Kofleriaceae bacterium]|jgi:hypothetical protein